MNEIIFFYPSFEKGGATKILIKIINFFNKKNIKVILITSKIYKKFLYKKNLKIIKISKIKYLNFFPYRWNITFSAMVVLGIYLWRKKKFKIKIFSMQSHLGAIVVSKIFNRKIIIRNSEELFGATKYADNKFLAFIVLIFKILFYNLCDQIIAISKKSENSLKKIVLNKNKVLLIYNPYLDKIYKINKKNNKSEFNILSVGRFTKQKNFDILLQAFDEISKKLQNIKLTLIGSGPLEDEIKLKYKNNNKIKILSWKSNLSKYYLNSDLFVLTSFYEGLPNVLIEAVNYNIPVISTDVSGAKDILLGQKGGNIIPIDNKKILKSKILNSISNYNKFKKKAFIAKKKVYRFSNRNLNYLHDLICKN